MDMTSGSNSYGDIAPIPSNFEVHPKCGWSVGRMNLLTYGPMSIEGLNTWYEECV